MTSSPCPSSTPRSLRGLRPLWRIPNCEILRPCADNVEPEEAEPLDRAGSHQTICFPRRTTGLPAIAVLPTAGKRAQRTISPRSDLMTTIEAEARHARPDEQERLARFTAFGACDLADPLFRRAGDTFAPAWEDLGVELEQLVSRDELANLKRATQYAHYTPEFIIRAIWRDVRQMGFDGGRVLEPGCGSGLFFALCPEALAGKTSADRRRGGPVNRPDRQTPLPERPHPA